MSKISETIVEEMVQIANTNYHERFNHSNCPLCGTELVSAGNRQYETLTEHCFDPNKETYPERASLKCPNGGCKTWGKGFWGDGGWYSFGEGNPELVGLPMYQMKPRIKVPVIYSEYMSLVNKMRYNKRKVYIGDNWRVTAAKALRWLSRAAHSNFNPQSYRKMHDWGLDGKKVRGVWIFWHCIRNDISRLIRNRKKNRGITVDVKMKG